MSPYVITTTREGRYPGALHPQSRRAVATLEEARDVGSQIADDHMQQRYAGAFRGAFNDLAESGGTVGPLPDGTVIEVVHVCDTWCILVAEDAGHEFPDPENVTVQEGVDAYNAVQS